MADLQKSNTSCPICLNLHKPAWTLLDFEIPRDGRGDLHHEFSPKEVVGSAEKGCRGCRLITTIFPYDLSDPDIQTGCLKIQRPYMNVKISIFHVLQEMSYEDSSIEAHDWEDDRELLRTVGSGHNKVEKISLTALDGPISLCAYLRNASKISGDTGSDQAVSWVEFWLKECSRHHERCSNPETLRLPTRVLFLKGSKDVSLVVSNGEVASYACLSYCWGKRHPIKTTTSTHARYLEGIPWEDLPKTFQDAISFVYRLGIKYLWIDSLCILQDSIDDWLQEGSKMSHIYRDSLITLSATLGEDSYEGLFTKSTPDHISQHLITTDVDESLIGIHHRAPLRHTFHISPLSSRGWVFQERLLSPRVLLFGREELMWECRKGDVCECSSIVLDTSYELGRQSASYDCLRSSSSVEELEYSWELLVEEYSAKSLTKVGDIFPALQGLAKVVSPVMGHYLAGHWNASLVHSLVWYRTFHATVRVADRWCAPTWSWASSSGRVRWPNQGLRLRQSLCTVLSATTVPIGEDVTGQLDSGWLVLKGKYLPCKTRYNTDSSRPFSSEIDTHVGSVSAGSSAFRRYPFILDRSEAIERHGEGDGPDAKAFLVCEDSVAQYWLILTTAAISSAYKRLGLMIIEKWSPEGQETLRLFESAAEEIEVTII